MAKPPLPPGPPLRGLSPMLLHEKRKPFSSADYLFELKFDGYRLLGEANEGSVVLKTRRGNDATAWFPEVAQGLALLPGGRHVIDAEVCVLDEIGRSDFERIQNRARRRCWFKGCDPVTLCAFDLLVHNGRDVMGLPLMERKARLAKLLTPRPPSVLYVGDIPHEGEALFQQAAALKLEGVIGKRKDSIYLPGERAQHWIKIKRPGWDEGRTWRN